MDARPKRGASGEGVADCHRAFRDALACGLPILRTEEMCREACLLGFFLTQLSFGVWLVDNRSGGVAA